MSWLSLQDDAHGATVELHLVYKETNSASGCIGWWIQTEAVYSRELNT